jgi:uncharacterized membrane protein YcaP (DUF421 family)
LNELLDHLVGVDWGVVFGLDTPLLEILIRGSIVYLTLFFLLRVVVRRQAGGLGISDLLVIVLIADAVQNAMAGEYRSVTDGLLLGGTIVFWSWALDWLAYHWRPFGRFVNPEPLQVIRDGRVMQGNLRSQLLTEEDVLAELRQHGLRDLSNVDEAFLESDGRISVIPKDSRPIEKPDRPLN